MPIRYLDEAPAEQPTAAGSGKIRYLDDPKEPLSTSRTALEQGLQGATFGFSDEAMDRLGAGIASIFTGESYDQLLQKARGMSQERMQMQLAESPEIAIPASLAGTVLTGAAGAGTKAGQALIRGAGSGGTAARIAKGGLAGAASGAAFGAGTAQEGERLSSAAKSAILGSALGAAIPAIGSAVRSTIDTGKAAARGLKAQSPEELAATASQIRQNASALYRKAREAGVIFKPEAAQKISSITESTVKKLGKMNPRIHGDTMAVLDDLRDASQKAGFGLEDLDQFRQLFQDAVRKNTDISGKMNPDALYASRAIDTIDRVVNGIGQGALQQGDDAAIGLLKEGRRQWAQLNKFERIKSIVEKAGGDPAKLKRGLSAFATNAQKSRGFSDTERRALLRAANSSTSENLLKGLGRFGIEPNNVFLPVVSGGFGAAVGSGGVAGGLVGIGTVARQMNKLVGRAKADELLNILASGAKNQEVQQFVSKLPQSKAREVMALLSTFAGTAGGK